MSNQISFNVHHVEFEFAGQTCRIETGRIARQATGAVYLTVGETAMLATCVRVPSKEPRGFLPLTVNYIEKFYAVGRVPGGFNKREGRPTERETLISRMIDRPLRPLFPNGMSDDLQVIVTVMSSDKLIEPDIPAMIAASAAVRMSGSPSSGAIGAARIGLLDDQFVVNPSPEQILDSGLNMVVSGTKDAVLMVESEASGLSEERMLEAVMLAHESQKVAIDRIEELANKAGVSIESFTPISSTDSALESQVHEKFASKIADIFKMTDKRERNAARSALRSEVVESFGSEDFGHNVSDVYKVISNIEKSTVREAVLSGQPRIDGRDTKTVRPISIETGILPRAHGSALFTRGETQAIVTLTMGGERDSKLLDDLGLESKENFMLHYNFPPFSVGETSFLGTPKRREIGHGKLAKRALEAVMPSMEDFPYTRRVVSEITESNGSSSMATVCGASLAMMDAGLPIKSAVAGVAMGLVKEGSRHTVLTDILGDEDHLGDMDFKVAGTSTGITALQMDIKIDGITKEIMREALAQAKDARLHILSCMNQAISAPREEFSKYAPRQITFQIKQDKIRDVIGRGGSTIREITDKFGVVVDVNDDGTIMISTSDPSAGDAAKNHILELTAEAEVGDVYTSKIVKIMDFGAFVNLPTGRDGFLHISQISGERIYDINDVLSEGQVVTVKVTEIDRQGRVRVSMKETEQGH